MIGLNISDEEQRSFIHRLENKYGSQFSSDPLFLIYLDSQFSFRGKTIGSHLLNFLAPAELTQFLQKNNVEKKSNYYHGFFQLGTLVHNQSLYNECSEGEGPSSSPL